MANIKVKDLTDTATISSDNQLMVLTNDANNVVQNITVENFNQNIISTDADNGITQGADGNLYVNNADTGVTAGTYQYPQNLVVDAKGKITSVESGSPASVPIATTSQAGIVKPDGTTITVEADGTITAIHRNIGEIVASTIPLTDAGLHLLDGSLISGSGSYADFVDYIASLYGDGGQGESTNDNDSVHCTQINITAQEYVPPITPNYFCTEAEWQQSATDYGVCGKFVYDSVNNTVRLPKITGFTEGTIAPTTVGDLTEAGLPNITGSFDLGAGNNTLRTESNAYSTTGAISAIKGSSNNGNSSTGYGLEGFTFDASNSNSIYGNSTTVQPQSIKVLYYIVVATSTKTDIQVDIDQIATDLNGKADIDLSNSNPSAGFASKLNTAGIRTVVETYQNGNSWYRVYSDGWCEQGGVSSYSGSTSFLKPFKNVDYYINTNQPLIGGGFEPTTGITSRSTTGFSVYSASEGGAAGSWNVTWIACGYIN